MKQYPAWAATYLHFIRRADISLKILILDLLTQLSLLGFDIVLDSTNVQVLII
jgi:hypothetical protein